MSLNKSATRRISLLTSASIAAAGLSFAGIAIAPSVAQAQAVCTPPPTTGAGSNTVTYAAATYNPGITCTASGGAMNVSTTGAITVSSTGGVPADPLVNGVNLVGGTQNVTWNSTAGTVTGSAQTNGPVIEATTTTGTISITTAAVSRQTTPTASAGNTITAGVRATSTTGAIGITANGAINIGASPTGTAAIEAISSGGAVSITTAGGMTGRLRGILAQTSGTGTVTLAIGGAVSASTTVGVGEAGIETIAGTGATVVNITSGTIRGGAGPAIRSVSSSTLALTAVNVQQTGGTVEGRFDFSGVSAGGVTYNVNGTSSGTGAASWDARGASVFSAFNDTVTIGGNAIFLTAANAAIALGAGNDTFTVNGTALTSNTLAAGTVIDFGDGNDTFNFSAPRSRAAGVTLNFGSGADTMNLGGIMVMEGLTITGADTLNLLGTVLMGGLSNNASNNPSYDFINTDGDADDVLIMTDGTWNGAGGRVVMDVRIDLPQEGCATLTGAADCLDLRGASSSGETLMTLNYIGDGSTLGAFSTSGITLVDMAGAGTSAQGHFVIDPDTVGYGVDPMFGGVLTRAGLFSYGIRYDPENQRHVLVGLPRSEALEYTMLSSAASSIWHMTAEAVNERQTDLRAGTEGVVWLRTTGEYTKRSVSTAFDSFGETFLIDNGYKLYAGTIMGGMDFVAGTSGGYDYVVGGQIGYVGSSFDLNASESSGRFSGATGGVYGSIWTERFFLDGTFNMNGLTLDYDQPGLGSKTNTFVNAFGARLDGGLRHRLTETIFAEPLASVAFVRTSFEEISLSGGEIQPADAQSRRAALGLRVGADFAGASVNWSYFLTGRAWNEFDGESGGAVHNPGVDLPFSDDFSGTFGEAEAGLGLANDAGTVSGFLASGVKFKDGYSAVDLSGGLRLRW